MAVINIDDVYILDETGAEVDKVTGLFTKNENATMGEKQMARLNIAAGGSNRNLLDNAYFVGGGSQLGDGIFPINQKGQTSYPGGSAFDRWVSDNTITLTASGLQATATTFQNQSKEFFDFLLGKIVTYSILTAGGTVKQATIQFPSAYPSSVYLQEVFNDGVHSIALALFPPGNGQVVRLLGADIAAAKLEIGSYSTLANDVRPDFGKVLEKCKRYLQRVKQPQGYTASVGFGMVGAASNILRTTIPLSSPLRNAASITATATNTGQMFVWGNGSYYSVTGVTGRTVLNGNAIVDITVNGTLENYKTYNLILNNADAYIDLSAPL